MVDLPSGTVTFLFTDIEGSTRLLHELGSEKYAHALAEHRRILREAFARHGGVEVETPGDAFFVAFPTAPGALRAAAEAVGGLAAGLIHVRMGIHTGTPLLTNEGYVGIDVHRAARIAAAGHGGQILVSASTASIVDREHLRDLGEHRLKDLSAPERIYQFGDNQFPPLKTLYRANLPVPATPFLGRDQELGEVLALLGGDTRLLTLTGPGGTGKTRLALQAAGAKAEKYPDGIWWVPLAPLRDPLLVQETIARTLGAQGDLGEHIADAPMLLLLDNFEQVVEAASDVARLVASCPNLDILVTSREPLHVSGEQEYPVPPLSPDEGVALFLSRARSVKPEFDGNGAVSEICRRLDDLPLAVELAAARVKALSPQQILERVEQRLPLLTGGARDLPERQRTLRATIEWSHDLLTPEEQRLFALLAVFRGGCTLESAEHVCEADLDTLHSLVDKSLVRHRGDRFSMLETIREFAADRLEASGEADGLRQRHAQHFLALAEEAARHDLRWGPERGDWLSRLESEHDNLRAALDRFQAAGDGERALRLCASAWRFWRLKDHREEGRRRLEQALAADDRSTTDRASVLIGLSVLANELGDAASGKLCAQEALALTRELSDVWGVALSLYQLGHTAFEEKGFEAGRQLFYQAERLFNDVGDRNYALKSRALARASHYDSGDMQTARAIHEDVVRQARELGNTEIETDTLGTLAQYAMEEGRVTDAFSLLREVLPRVRKGVDRSEVALDVRRIARAFAMEGKVHLATVLLSSSEALREATGFKRRWFAPPTDDELAPFRGNLDEAAFAEAWAAGQKLSVDEAIELALEASADAAEPVTERPSGPP